MSSGRNSKNGSAGVCYYCYSNVALETSEALAQPLWGSCTSRTAVEGVVNEDVTVHAEQISTLRTCIRLQ